MIGQIVLLALIFGAMALFLAYDGGDPRKSQNNSMNRWRT